MKIAKTVNELPVETRQLIKEILIEYECGLKFKDPNKEILGRKLIIELAKIKVERFLNKRKIKTQ